MEGGRAVNFGVNKKLSLGADGEKSRLLDLGRVGIRRSVMRPGNLTFQPGSASFCSRWSKDHIWRST